MWYNNVLFRGDAPGYDPQPIEGRSRLPRDASPGPQQPVEASHFVYDIPIYTILPHAQGSALHILWLNKTKGQHNLLPPTAGTLYPSPLLHCHNNIAECNSCQIAPA